MARHDQASESGGGALGVSDLHVRRIGQDCRKDTLQRNQDRFGAFSTISVVG
jgi:hypothetical protein